MSHGRCDPAAGENRRALVLGATSVVADPLLSRLVTEGFEVQGLGLVVAALVIAHHGEVVHRAQRFGVVVAQHVLLGFQGREIQRLGLLVAAQVLVEYRQVVHGREGLPVVLA